MRIVINTLSVTDANEGIRTMLTGLVPALVRAGGGHRYRLICSPANEGLFAAVSAQVDVTVVRQDRRRPLARIIHDQVTVPWLVRHDTELLLTPSTVGSILAPVPQVVLVVAHLAFRSIRRETAGAELPLAHRVYYGPLMRLSHRRATALVATSQFLAERLVADTGVSTNKVYAIPHGIDRILPDRPLGSEAGAGYVLFVGTLYPYKNAEVVIRALAAARPRLPEGFRAVIVGRDPDGRQRDSLQRLAAAQGVADAVSFAGKVDDAELERLYRGATALLVPSLAEGFGLTALEAMARGVPVIASDRTSLPEVVGDAGLLVDPERADLLADAVVRVVGEPGLPARMADAGRIRAAQLSWDEAARAFIALFAEVARSGG